MLISQRVWIQSLWEADNQHNFDNLGLGLTEEKRNYLSVRLGSFSFELKHKNLIKVVEDTQHIKVTEEDEKGEFG